MSLVERCGNYVYKLTEKGIRELIANGEMGDYIWDYINYDNVSERFIREYQDKVIWAYVIKKKNLSEQFKKDFGIY